MGVQSCRAWEHAERRAAPVTIRGAGTVRRAQHAGGAMSQARSSGQSTQDDERAEREVHEIEQLMGNDVERDQAVFPVEGIDDLGQMTDTRIYEGELEARPADSDQPDEPQVENLEFLESL